MRPGGSWVFWWDDLFDPNKLFKNLMLREVYRWWMVKTYGYPVACGTWVLLISPGHHVVICFFQKQIHQEARASLAPSQGWHGSPKYVRGWCIQFQCRWCHHICSTKWHNSSMIGSIFEWIISAFISGGSIPADFWWLLPWLPFIAPTSSPRWYKYHWADPAISEPRFAMEKLP